MKLTKEDIQFIDQYLENSDVIHVDIRMEMTDHIASEIEAMMEGGDQRAFYFIFKDYMVANKHSLLSNNKSFIKATDKQLSLSIFKALMEWPSLLTFLICMLLFTILNMVTNISVLKSWVGVLPLIGFVFFGVTYFVQLKWFKLERFSALERMGFIYVMAFHLFHFCWSISNFKKVENNYVVYVFSSLALALLVAMVLVAKNKAEDYKNRFKVLV
ncbi:hypothetical protein BWZ20_09410 [Winogradskyella sp. J14-2]|uniref:hypothetical protein n=1 Tax=Winogradskyella sp. J14-2 TaxID=1936080 RepID=UPI000972B111|nr:hypothetical protein [Winogradskyella sp. J14-2]APY08503.1 hypothetical protein BWZ20_09410 [Winogradskyella sp. J14-2]